MPVAGGIELYLNWYHLCFHSKMPSHQLSKLSPQFSILLSQTTVCAWKGLIFNQRPALVAGVFTLWPSILFLGGDSGFQYLLAVAVSGSALPRTDASDSGGLAASPLFKRWLHGSARIHCSRKPRSRDEQFRVWSRCGPALETSCNCFHLSYTHSFARLELLQNPESFWLEFELGKAHKRKGSVLWIRFLRFQWFVIEMWLNLCSHKNILHVQTLPMLLTPRCGRVQWL